MKIFANNIVMSPRECVYFAAVTLLLLPPEPFTMKDITGWMTFLVVFLMLFEAVVATLRDKTIFLWDKIMFVSVSVFSMVATGITTFFGTIEIMRTLALILGCLVCLFMLVTGVVYMVLQKKNWSLPVPFEAVTRFWFSNNLACLSLMLAVSHSL